MSTTHADAIDKTSREWQEAQRDAWHAKGYVPDVLDLYEAAAYVRMSERTLRDLCAQGRDKKAQLRHQRFGTAYRFKKTVLDSYGEVEDRSRGVAA